MSNSKAVFIYKDEYALKAVIKTYNPILKTWKTFNTKVLEFEWLQPEEIFWWHVEIRNEKEIVIIENKITFKEPESKTSIIFIENWKMQKAKADYVQLQLKRNQLTHA